MRTRAGVRSALAVLGLGLCCLTALAQQVGTFNYRGGGQGPVTFDHGTHASQGYVCVDCHTTLPSTGTQLFQTLKQGLISIADHSGNAQCFACHDGSAAFSSCNQCHR
jgi:c(7)-type cytochrome triheme protein